MSRSISFPATLAKAEKAQAARTGVAETPVAIRSRIPLDDALREEVRHRLARKVGKFALHLERLSVRFEDLNGPKGGVDIVCRIKAVVSSRPSVVVEERAADPRLALSLAAEALARALRRTLGRAEFSAPRPRGEKGSKRSRRDRAASMRDDSGSLIGARVGRGAANLEAALARPEKQRRDAFIDTAAPGVSASDRHAGYGATAARNTKRNRAGMQSALEDSRTTPSRKSTRRSVNRGKSATPIERTVQLAAHDPGARASRDQVRKGGPRVRR